MSAAGAFDDYEPQDAFPDGAARLARPSATVIICAYTLRRWETLQSSVVAVQDQLSPGDELVVVIDHNDELFAYAKARFQGVSVIPNAQRQGLSGARNTGVAVAASEVVVFLDDDAVPEPDWLDLLLGPYEDRQVIGVGGLAAPHWEAERPSWFPAEFLWVVGCSYEGLPGPGAAIRNPIGANMSFRRSVFGAVGDFSHALGRTDTTPTGCEETELSIRASRAFAGSRIVHQPTARVNHHVTRDRLEPSYFRHRCWSEGQSKALVRIIAGGQTALSTERRYVTRVLPRGIQRGVRDGLHGDLGGLGRSLAITGGTMITMAGYLSGLLKYRNRP